VGVIARPGSAGRLPPSRAVGNQDARRSDNQPGSPPSCVVVSAPCLKHNRCTEKGRSPNEGDQQALQKRARSEPRQGPSTSTDSAEKRVPHRATSALEHVLLMVKCSRIDEGRTGCAQCRAHGVRGSEVR